MSGSEIDVDTHVLDAVSNVLYEAGTQVRRAGTQAQADTVTAAHAFERWKTGASLNTLAARWSTELDRLGSEANELCNTIARAASEYRAADAHSLATVVDDTHIRGR
jgi:hypothetical protein